MGEWGGVGGRLVRSFCFLCWAVWKRVIVRGKEGGWIGLDRRMVVLFWPLP